MIKCFVTVSLAISLSLSTSSCHAMNATPAERCVFVDLPQRKGHELTPLLDEFAKSRGLLADKSHPINPTYARRSDSGKFEAEISYRVGMGEFGAALALFRYDKTLNAELLAQFDHFIEETVASKYKITPCEPEQYPTAYR